MINHNQIIDDAKQFAKDNLKECCKELVEWGGSTVLVNGKVRELARMLNPINGGRSLAIAESIIKTVAFEHIVEGM